MEPRDYGSLPTATVEEPIASTHGRRRRAVALVAAGQTPSDIARVPPRHIKTFVPPERQYARELLAPAPLVHARPVHRFFTRIHMKPPSLFNRPGLGPDVVRRVPDVARLEAAGPEAGHEGVGKLAAAARPRLEQ